MNQGGSVKSLSIVIPAKNEAVSIGDIVKSAAAEYPGAESIVVDVGEQARSIRSCTIPLPPDRDSSHRQIVESVVIGTLAGVV